MLLSYRFSDLLIELSTQSCSVLFWFLLLFRLNGPLWIVRSAFWLDGPLFDLDGPNLDFVPLLDVLVQFFSVLQLLVKRQEFRILLLGGGRCLECYHCATKFLVQKVL